MDSMIPEIGQVSVDTIKEHYVYELFDRRDGTVFYVGEGVRDRALQHINESERLRKKILDHPEQDETGRDDILISKKVERIQNILGAGKDHLGVRVIGRFDSKNEARAVETVLINWVYGIENLTNISRGRGANSVRPRTHPTEELSGIDIERQVRVFGSGKVSTGYLQDKIENHEKHDHLSMAEDIADHLRNVLSGATVEDPCFWESGRYIAIFVTLVPNKVRMIIQLTDSGRNQHVYNLKPMSERQQDVALFKKYMTECHPDVELRNRGLYAKLPEWPVNFAVLNEDLDAISEQVNYALEFFSAS